MGSRNIIMNILANLTKPLTVWGKTMKRLAFLIGCLAIIVSPLTTAAGEDIPVRKNSSIDLVYMGANDCQPCRLWKAFDLPKLRASNEFPHIRFTDVQKWIQDPIPGMENLPEHLRPMRDELVRVINRKGGSPMFALLVDGKGIKGGWGTKTYDDLRPIMDRLVARKLSAAD